MSYRKGPVALTLTGTRAEVTEEQASFMVWRTELRQTVNSFTGFCTSPYIKMGAKYCATGHSGKLALEDSDQAARRKAGWVCLLFR